jgi:hypothetical protein
MFVQFVDGSSWGDSAAAAKSLRDRQLVLEQLEILKEDEKREGRKEFLEALSQPTILQPILSLQDLYSEKRDLSLVVGRVNDMLENARVRKP